MCNPSFRLPGTFVNVLRIRHHWDSWGKATLYSINSSLAMSTATYAMVLMGWGGATTSTSVASIPRPVQLTTQWDLLLYRPRIAPSKHHLRMDHGKLLPHDGLWA